MMIRSRRARRRAASLVEAALICPVLFLLTVGIVVGAVAIYRYQEVAHLAREGARYAATHGGRYTEDGQPAATGVSAIASSSDLTSYLSQETIALDPNYLTVSVTWETMDSSGTRAAAPGNYPSYVDTTTLVPGQMVKQNYVVVTVSYQWLPEAFLVGPITLTSTAEMPMSY
jgi:Flp pilus assembly protein TadG